MMADGACRSESRERHRPAPGTGSPSALGWQHVGVPTRRVEDVGLFAVVRALHDGQEVVLAPGEKARGDADVVHGVVDPVELVSEKGADEEDQVARPATITRRIA